MRELQCPVRVWRKNNGLTIGQAADVFGVARITLAKWEGGDNIPNLQSGINIADELGIDTATLYREWMKWHDSTCKRRTSH